MLVMMSDALNQVFAYHEATKHSWESVRGSHHGLDWANKPLLFKIYPDAPAIVLPREVSAPVMPARRFRRPSAWWKPSRSMVRRAKSSR